MKPVSISSKKILEVLTNGLTTYNSRVIQNSESFMAVTIERLANDLIGARYSICHYQKQNGDLVRDPEVVFIKGKDEQFYPISFRQDHLGIDQDLISYDMFGNFKDCIDLKEQHNLVSFCNTWMQNIKEQQGL